MQEFSVFAIVFAILALSGGLGEIPDDAQRPNETGGLITTLTSR